MVNLPPLGKNTNYVVGGVNWRYIRYSNAGKVCGKNDGIAAVFGWYLHDYMACNGAAVYICILVFTCIYMIFNGCFSKSYLATPEPLVEYQNTRIPITWIQQKCRKM